jgi:hypothetical protein
MAQQKNNQWVRASARTKNTIVRAEEAVQRLPIRERRRLGGMDEE